MLCMIDGHDELRLPMHNAVCQASLVGGELWVAISQQDYESESSSVKVKSGDVVGAASWYPSGSDFLSE